MDHGSQGSCCFPRYEQLSGRASWQAWNAFAAFLGAPPLEHDPNVKEPGAYSTPPCSARVLNWPALSASPPVASSPRTLALCRDPFDPLWAPAAFL